jgi:hypothetical protein
VSSNPHTRAIGKEFDALVALGPKVLPLVVEGSSTFSAESFLINTQLQLGESHLLRRLTALAVFNST